MSDIQQILNDPNFKGLPLPEKNKVLMKVDPNFAGLPGPERMKVLSVIQYGKPLPSPTPPLTLKSGLKAAARGIADPFEGIGEVVTEGIPSLAKQTFEAAQRPPQTTGEKVATAFGPEALVGYRMLVEPQQQLAEKAKKSKGLQKAGYTAAAALPVAGPFAASLGESIQKPTDIAKAGGKALAWTELPQEYAKELPRPASEHLRLGLKDVDDGLGASAGKAGRKAAAMTRDVRVAAPDLIAAADEVDPKLKGAEKLHDLADKVAARKEEVWQKGHEPGFRAFGTREVEMAPVKKAAAKGLGKVGDWVNRPEANSARAWISGLPDRMTLNELDDFVRELNADLVNKDPRDAMGYGPKGIQARLNAVEEARNVIDKKLEDAGMPGVKDYNKRYGALKKIEDQLQVRAVQLARKEARNNLDLMPKWAHIYSFWHGHGIPFLALGIHGAGLFEKTPADVLFRGIDRLRKSGIQPTPFPATPPLPNIRGLLGEGPKIMSAVPDESYVRGVTAIAEAPEAIRKGRLLPQGEGVGPLTVGPSPLSPIAGSESTPTGGARGYPTQPQPKFPMTPYERVNVTQTEFPPSAAERTAQRQLPAGSAEVSPYRSGRTPTPGQIIRFQGAYWMFNGQDWEYIPANRLPPFPERKTR